MNQDPVPTDEHLRAALRHAPDAAREAPPALAATIRAAARQATRREQTTLWQRAWTWLGEPRHLGASGAFATVALAGVLTLAWRDEVPPPIAEGPPAPAAAPAPQGEAARKAEGPLPPAASGVGAAVTAIEPAAAPTAAPRPAAAPRSSAKAAPEPAAAQRAEPLESNARRVSPAPNVVANEAPARAPEAAAAAATQSPQPAATAAPAQPSAPPPIAAPAPAAAKTADSAVAEERALAPLQRSRPAALARPASGIETSLDAWAATATLAAPDASADSRRPAAALLRELRGFTAGRWVPSGSAEGPATVVVWSGAERLASIWLDAESVVLCRAGTSGCHRAALDRAQIEALRSAAIR